MQKFISFAMVILLTSCSSQSKSMESNQTSPHAPMLCSSKPNCVSTQETRKDYQVAPFVLTSSDISLSQIETVALSFPRTETIEKNDDYLHLTFTSLVLRFTDDVEIVKEGIHLHIRSKSRVGHSDFGVNRERLQKLRTKLLEQNLIQP
uniref:DUF1499 domain-containing protein n=2 Tax=Vibrionaceae TaxID=641 RepID=A0A5Q0TEI9_9VIBR